MLKVLVYGTQFCPYCVRAKQLLASKNVAVNEVRIDLDAGARATMIRLSGRRTVPQIWIGDLHVGGFDDLWALDRRGELDVLLQSGVT